MSCHHEVNLTAYLDGELTGAERSALESHLPVCAECARTLGLLRHSVATLAALPTFEPSPATRRAVLRRVEAHPHSWTLRLQRLAPRLLMPALGLAAVAVGVFAFGHAVGARHRPGRALRRNPGARHEPRGGRVLRSAAGRPPGRAGGDAMRHLVLLRGLLGALEVSAQPTSAERFQSLPEAQKQALRERLRTFKALPPEQQARVRENLARFRQLPAEELSRVRANLRRLEQLTPEQRDRLRRRFEEYRSLPPERREQLREGLRAFLDANPDQREQMLERLERWRRMSP